MRWEGERESGNVIDRRGMGTGTIIGGGVGTLVLALLVYLLGGNPAVVLQNAPPPSAGGAVVQRTSPEAQRQKEFVSVVLADTEDVWHAIFREHGLEYREPKLVLFTGQVDSACGFASAAVGPFYCDQDERVYIDLSFYDELKRRFGAPGDFAQAYVIAHEVGHHVQNLLGILGQVNARRRQVDEAEANRLSVRLELQADYLAGVWANHAQRMKHILDPNDIQDALRAASAIGDDRLQKESQGYVVPDSFTHGTSAQRVAAFTAGWKRGELPHGLEIPSMSGSEAPSGG